MVDGWVNEWLMDGWLDSLMEGWRICLMDE